MDSSQTKIWTGNMTAGTWQQDFSPLVLEPPLPGADIALWPIIGKMMDGTNARKFEWIEEENTQLTLQVNGALSNTTEKTVTFEAGEIAKAGLRSGAVLKNATDRTKKELIMCDSVTNTTDAEFTRDYGGFVSGSGGGTTGETHADNDKFEIVEYLNFEGSKPDVVNDKFALRDRGLGFNYYTIMDDFTNISGSDLVTEYRGNHPANWGYQIQGLVRRLDRQFERALMSSPQVARSLSVQGSMGGLLWYATQTASTNAGTYVTTAGNFSYEGWDDGIKTLFELNGNIEDGDLVCLVPVAGLQFASTIHDSAMRMDYLNQNTRGMRATALQSTLQSKHIPLVPCRHMPSDAYMIVNLNALRIHFLRGRGLLVYTSPMGEALADREAKRYLSELTLEAHRPTENIYYHTGITWTRPS